MEKMTKKYLSTNHIFYQPNTNNFHLIQVSRFFHNAADPLHDKKDSLNLQRMPSISGLDFDKYFFTEQTN